MKKVIHHLHRVRKKILPKKKRHWLLLFFIVLLVGTSIAFYEYILKDLPSPKNLSTTGKPQSTQIFDRNGVLLYTIYGTRNETFIPLSEVPKNVQNATIAIEDKDFYHHGAIDLRGILRAFITTIFYKQLEGGSTITQQLVKNGLLSQERTVSRKLKEVILSFATELAYPKDKILEMYLNQSPYGGTAWGIEAASQTYFSKHAKDLDLAESAFLAGLPEAPSLYSPYGAHPEEGIARQKDVLTKMYQQGYITQKQEQQAASETLHFQKFTDQIKAPHFVFYIKDLLIQKYGMQMVQEGGLRVTTTLDLSLQNYAQSTVSAEIDSLKGDYVSNGAALITTPDTGEILAMVGSKDYFDTTIDGNVNVVLQRRQPGSSIKPINYAVALMKGLTAATPYVDQPICFPGSPPYCPGNYDNKWHGDVSMRIALANSFNIPAVKTLKYNGVPAMIATASAMGISTFDDPSRYGLSLTLGGGEVTMLDMATAYGVFANGGYRKDLHPILKVIDGTGKVLEEYHPIPSVIFGKKVIPPGVSYIISDILSDNNARSMEFGPRSALYVNGLPVSVKTGTTNDFRDNWTIGYTQNPSYLVAVWVGNNDNTPMGGLVSGITGAAPIWQLLMSHVLEGQKVYKPQKPDTVEQKTICAGLGTLVPPGGCPPGTSPLSEYFLKGMEPTASGSAQQNVWVDKSTNDLAKPNQTDNVELREETVATDPVGDRYCLTCPHPSLTPTPTPQ